MLILFSRSQGEEVALARAHGVVDLCSSDCIKGSENPSWRCCYYYCSSSAAASLTSSSVFRRSFRRSKDDDDVSLSEGRWRGGVPQGAGMGPPTSVVCVRWWSEDMGTHIWRPRQKSSPNNMRRNLKVILLMAIVWAGGLLYLAKNGDKPQKQVSQLLTFSIPTFPKNSNFHLKIAIKMNSYWIRGCVRFVERSSIYAHPKNPIVKPIGKIDFQDQRATLFFADVALIADSLFFIFLYSKLEHTLAKFFFLPMDEWTWATFFIGKRSFLLTFLPVSH